MVLIAGSSSIIGNKVKGVSEVLSVSQSTVENKAMEMVLRETRCAQSSKVISDVLTAPE